MSRRESFRRADKCEYRAADGVASYATWRRDLRHAKLRYLTPRADIFRGGNPMICMHGLRTLREEAHREPGRRRGISVANRLLSINTTCNALTIRTHFGIFCVMNQWHKSFLYCLSCGVDVLDATQDTQRSIYFFCLLIQCLGFFIISQTVLGFTNRLKRPHRNFEIYNNSGNPRLRTMGYVIWFILLQ